MKHLQVFTTAIALLGIITISPKAHAENTNKTNLKTSQNELEVISISITDSFAELSPNSDANHIDLETGFRIFYATKLFHLPSR